MGQRDKRLRITGVEWEEKPGNGYLLRELFDLLLRDPNGLTDKGKRSTMSLGTVEDEEGGER